MGFAMRLSFHQLLPSYAPRDAIGTEVSLLRDYLRSRGYQSDIYCQDKILNNGAKSAGSLADDLAKQKHTVTLFHFSVGTELTNLWSGLGGKRWLRYHNITPGNFFGRPDESNSRHLCNLGRLQLPQVALSSDLVISDSSYNSREVEEFAGGRTHVIPVLRDYEALVQGQIESELFNKISDRAVATVLFVGRVAPNKCHHDILQILALHKKISSRRVRVIFAGGYFSESYQTVIAEFAKSLGLKLSHQWDFDADVMSLGSVTNEELTSLYKSATLYASMSEHEGFGVPIVESMYFDLPVYAHAAAAVPEVLGQGHFLVDKFNWVAALDVFEKALFDETARSLELGRTRAWRRQFGLERARSMFLDLLA
jgi:glycosyltransferase involved in cell wall biosynthesis